jgi:hypothetical protein
MSKSVDPKVSRTGESLSFDFPIPIGRQAGGHDPAWSRRMKIDIHTIPGSLLDGAMAGMRLAGTLASTGKDGTPACATVPFESWRLD